MKKKLTFPALALTALLTACPSTLTPDPTYSLTVKLEGVSSAPVKVTNTTTGTVLFNDTLTSGKTFSTLPGSAALNVEGQAVNGYVTPAAQPITLSADKTVTLRYEPLPLTSLGGRVKLSAGRPPYAFPDGSAAGKTLHLQKYLNGQSKFDVIGTVSPSLTFQLGLPTAGQIAYDLKTAGERYGTIPAACQVTDNVISDPAALVSSIEEPGEAWFNLDAPELTISGSVRLWLRLSESDPAFLNPVYADRPLTMKFRGTCPLSGGSAASFNYDLKLRAGWNLVRDSSDKYGTSIYTYTSTVVDPTTLFLIP